jgi:hypothetical protein
LKRSEHRRAPRRRGAVLWVIAAALVPLACGQSGPEMARVSGTVTYKGKPVPKGTITFVAQSEGGRNATGELGPNGSYTLQTSQPGDGALLGEYKVTVYAHDEPVLDYIPTKPVKPQPLAPEKYEKPGTTDLKATVKSGSNKIDFDLTD